MPKVPTFDPQVNQEAIPSVRDQASGVSRLSVGGGLVSEALNEGLQKQAQSLMRIGLQEKKRADDVITTEYFSKALALKNDLTYDPKAGAVNVKGENVLKTDFIKNYQDQFQKGLDELDKNLYNVDQKMLAKEIRLRLTNEYNNTLDRHYSNEAERYEGEIAEASIKSLQNDSILNYSIPGKIPTNIDLMKAKLDEMGEKKGIPKEVTDQKFTEIRSNTHLGVLRSLVTAKKSGQAKAYFNLSKDQMNAGDQDQAKVWIEGESLRGQSQFLSDQILSKGLSYSQTLEEIPKIKDPELRDQTEKRVRQGLADRKQAQVMDETDSFNQAFDIISKTMDLDSVPVALEQRIRPSHWKELERYTGAKKNGKVIETKPEILEAYKDILANPATRQKAIQEMHKLDSEINNISEYDLKQLKELYAGVAKEDAESKKAIERYIKNSEKAKATLSDAGLYDVSDEEYLKFRNVLDKSIDGYYEDNGKYPDDEATQSILDGLVLNIEKRGKFIYDPNIKAYQLGEGNIPVVTIDQIPQNVRETIEDWLIERGKPVTNDAVLSRYLVWLGKSTNAIK